VDHFEAFLQPVFTAYAPAAFDADLTRKLEDAGIAGGLKATNVATGPETSSPSIELLRALTGPPVIVGVLGLLVAWWFYIKNPELPRKLAASVHALYTLLLNKYYVDEIYAALIVTPLMWISRNVLWHVVDEGVIDGTVNGVAHLARETGGEARKLQSGNARSYATWVIIGAVGFTVLLLGIWMVG